MAAADTRYLHDHVGTYAESWERDHGLAMEQWDLEARLRLALTLHDLIRTAAKRRGGAVSSAPFEAREAYLREFQTLYRDWLKPSGGILAVIERLAGEGYPVEGAARFEQACDELRGLLQPRVETEQDAIRS